MKYQGVRIAGIHTWAAMPAVTGCTSKTEAGESARNGAGYGALTGAVGGGVR